MSFDLSKLRGSEIKDFSYADTVKLVEALEKTVYDANSITNMTETLDSLLGYTNDIIEKIENNAFPDPITSEQKTNLKFRVEQVQLNFSLLAKVNVSVKEQIDAGVNEVIKMKLEMQKAGKKEKEDISQLEHTTLSHVLSIMGIFSAVITLIISVVVTSSSWLNNADGATAPIAFIVPNLVTLIAVFALMALVYFFVHHDNENEKEASPTKTEIQSTKAEIQSTKTKIKGIHIIIGIIVLLAILLSVVFVTLQHATPPTHARYIISPDQYEIVEEAEESSDNCPHNNACNCHTKSEIKKYFEITYARA